MTDEMSDMSESKRACLASDGPFILCPKCRARVPLREGWGSVGAKVWLCPRGCEDFGPGVLLTYS